MFNVDFQVINVGIVERDNGLELQLTVGLAVPQGPNEPPAFLPAGMVRVPLGKEASIQTGETLIEKANALPEPPKESSIIIPESPADVDRAAKIVEDVKGPSDS